MSLEKLVGPRRADGAPVDPVWAAHFRRELIQAVEEVSAIRISEFAARLAAGRPSIAVVGAGRRAREIALSVERLIGA